MDSIAHSKRLGWLLPIRLATYVLLFAEVVIWLGYPGFLQPLVIAYSAVTLAFVLILALRKRIRVGLSVHFIIALQFILEIALESGIIYSTGNINSPFSAFFLLTIVSAALAYQLVGTLITASAVSLAYAFIIWFGLGNVADPDLSLSALKTIFSAGDSVFYPIFLHILIFYLVAFVSGYLSEHLKERDRVLADTSKALRQARLETDDILRHVNSGLLTVDGNGNIIYFNRAAERILGYREEEVKGLPCFEVFAERMPDLADSLQHSIDHQCENPREEIQIINGEGKVLPLGASTSVLTQENNEFRGVIAIFTDLTEAKQMEAKIRTADRLAAVGELSASIAHEIRNPLAAISGSVQVLRRELDLTDENLQLMSLIEKESNRLNKILTDFLNYARVDRPSYNKVDLCHVVSEVIELLHHHHSFGENVNLIFDSEQPITYVVGDEDLIKQVLMNLAVNSCEAFGGNKGEIRFLLRRPDETGSVILRVADDGPGIAGELQGRVFQPFFSTKKGGTGLGLAIVHRICTAMKIGIIIDNGVSRGTTFDLGFQEFGASDLFEHEKSSLGDSRPVVRS